MTIIVNHRFVRGCALLGALFVAACSGTPATQNAGASTAAPPPPADVRTTQVQEREVPIVIRATGSFAADEASEVTPHVAGTIIATRVNVGAFVQAGQLLVQLDPRDAALRLQQAQASLQQAEAEALRAKVEADRNARLVQSGDISKSSYERMTAQVAVADAAVAQARAQLDAAQKAVDDTSVHAPFAGHVSARPVAVGEYVTTSSKLATVVRIQPIKLQLQLPEANASRLRTGMPVQAQVSAYPDQLFTGTVVALNVVIDPVSRAMMVDVAFPNRDSRLAPGMFGSAEVRLATTERALFLPKAAVVPTPDSESSAVYLIDGDKARLHVVHAGETRDGLVRIFSGVDAGAVVAASGVDRLFDGALVRATSATSPAAVTSR